MTFNQFRRFLYGLARVMGDINAISRGPRAMGTRLIRKAAGRAFGRIIGRIR